MTGSSALAAVTTWGLLACVAAASFAGLLGRWPSGVGPHEPFPTTGATVIVPYLDVGYRYKVVPFDNGAGFEQPSFDDSGFPVGAAGFGTRSGSCPLNNPSDAKTDWPVETDILLRKTFDLPPGATNLRVGVAIDNDVQVFINGQDVSGGLLKHEGCATRDTFVFPVPDSVVHEGPNLLAVRGRDRGVLSYVDVQIAADVRVCPLSQGYWKTHPTAWPVGSLTLGGGAYDEEALLSILRTPTRGDASVILARQLIAAKLNVASGSDPAPAASTISDADRALGAFTGPLPYGVGPSSTAGEAMVSMAAVLDSYNNGLLAPGC